MARNQRWREEFISIMGRRFGWTVYDCRTLLRLSATAQRLAEAACNGDYPADNGERKVQMCPKCEGGWVRSSFVQGVCPDCRIEQRIAAAVADVNSRAETDAQRVIVRTAGDPRGAVVALAAVGTDPDRSSDWIGVP